jgi:NAD(P)-dependent dehydrogenase (short-subunit alcohol dehydrogenase family)
MFTGKVAIVTGGVSGIGKATVLKFIAEGASVAILDLDEKAGVQLTEAIGRNGGKAMFVNCDVSNEESVKEAIGKVVDMYGRLDYAYNNAGIGGEFAKVENYPADDWDKVMAINLKGVFLCMKYEIPHILKQGKGAIVNCASLLSTVASENDSAYVASKFGVLGLTKNAALEYAATGLRINAVSPGFTKTPMIDKGDEEKLKRIAALHPIGRLADPEEIAEAVIWLCSDRSSFAIGLNLLVDGGYTIV